MLRGGRGWPRGRRPRGSPHARFRSQLPSKVVCGGSLRRSHVEREAELSVRALWWHLPAQGGLSLPYAGSKGNAELQMLFTLSHGSSRSHLPHSEGRSA